MEEMKVQCLNPVSGWKLLLPELLALRPLLLLMFNHLSHC